MIFICLKPQYKIVISRDVAASRQLAPEVIMVMFMSPLDAPGRGWDLWRFASLIPSGCRLPPIHKVRALKKSPHGNINIPQKQ